MGLIRGRSWWWNRLRRELFQIHKISKGHINLSYGRHEVFISIPASNGISITRIYLSCEGTGNPVCQGDIDMCNYTMTDDGFVIYADIKHNISKVYWLIEYDILDGDD